MRGRTYLVSMQRMGLTRMTPIHSTYSLLDQDIPEITDRRREIFFDTLCLRIINQSREWSNPLSEKCDRRWFSIRITAVCECFVYFGIKRTGDHCLTRFFFYRSTSGCVRNTVSEGAVVAGATEGTSPLYLNNVDRKR